MLIVGLTGGIGSGKSTVAEQFAKLNVDQVDADQLSREVVQPGSEALQAIAARFGPGILTSTGELNRPALREIVFADEQQRLWLEALLHPLIGQLLQERLQQCQPPYCLLVSPLLLETRQHELVDRVLVVDVSEATQLQRALRRDCSDEDTIRGIMSAQLPRQERLARADDVLDNEPAADTLESRVAALHEHYLKLASHND